jgi:starch phosphorylase
MVDLLKNIDDDNYRSKFLEIKRKNKENLSNQIFHCCGTKVDPDSIFDIQVKRIHAYKRLLLNAFHIMDLYRPHVKDNPDLDISPRAIYYRGKAAPNLLTCQKKLLSDKSNCLPGG